MADATDWRNASTVYNVTNTFFTMRLDNRGEIMYYILLALINDEC
ncbi:hypothetical protein Cst_c00700 [Thermoclostridium stercorarium subsp. stercorarium DSM 8532]|uniref:Uncharacterized protein n=1 Tax=Thermoclostridium stercorarium (strain ATCC 35414 / DSM 8532 / NCIMB 11754) TaxID=1121335 RepID=L7VK60_THES1|nr:hypothetical protein Cst_c00700 [Thermoclostridium stercorarium subsp. stercorarium DSM 8532]